MSRVVFSFLALVVFLTTGCDRQMKYTISGTWKGADGQVVRLLEGWGENQDKVIDSVIVKDGRFHLEKPINQVGRGMLEFGTYFRPVLLDGEPVEIEVEGFQGDTTVKNSFVLQGSPEQTVMDKVQGIQMLRMFAMAFGDSGEGPDALIESYIDSNLNRKAIAYFMEDLLASKYSLPAIEKNYERLTPDVKISFPGKSLKASIDDMKPTSLGGIAPDIDLPDVDGNHEPLYSLRGKYVLVDFWASWCGPCRKEIPNLKMIYEKYKDRGFEIYSVSLDDKREAWITAIAELDLPWVHVSSLKGWDCPVAKRYHVTGISKMFLLDPEGKIVAVDLRGEDLEKKVDSFFNNM